MSGQTRREAAASYQLPRRSPLIDLRLDANEGPLPPASLSAKLPLAEGLRRYPDASGLEAQLAEQWDCSAEEVLVTAGIDDGLARALTAFTRPGEEALAFAPSFEMIPVYCRLNQVDCVQIPWRSGACPVDALVKTSGPRTRVIVVVSPNNPTGLAVSPGELRRIHDGAPDAIILVDEAYGEFASQSLADTAMELDRCILLKTFSKAWGLAGARVGYAIGDGSQIQKMRAVGQPYAVAAPSLALASAWLVEGVETMKTHVRAVIDQRQVLSDLLQSYDLEPLPSEGNFLFLEGPRALGLQESLAAQGIAVRRWKDRPGLQEAIRITLPGVEAEFARLCSAIEVALNPQALLFDLDGVIADVSRSYRECIRRTVVSFGGVCRPAAIVAAKAAGNANNDWILCERLLEEQELSVPLEEIIERFDGFYQELAETESLLVDPLTLAALGESRPLAIVTGRPRAEAEEFLERFDIRAYFRELIVMEDGPAKPDPYPIREALRRLGCERAWMIGDTPDDLRAARSAGVLPWAVLAPGDGAAMESALRTAGAETIFDGLDNYLKFFLEQCR